MDIERDILKGMSVNTVIFLLLNFNETDKSHMEYRSCIKKNLLLVLEEYYYTFLQTMELEKFNLLELAIDSRDPDIISSVSSLTSRGDINKYLDIDILQYCLQRYSLAGIQTLLRLHRQGDYYPNYFDKGNTSFILACKYALNDLIDFYLRHYGPEIDLELTDSEGHTAEYYAYINGNYLLYNCLNRHSGLPPVTLQVEYDICGICREDCVVTLDCGHYFHFECISQWMDQSKCCPMCRSDL